MDLEFSSKVRPEQAKKTIVQALSERFPYYSMEQWENALNQGLIKHNAELTRDNIIVQRDDEITYIAKNYQEPEVPTHYEEIYQNPDLLIVGKPAGSPVIKTGKIFYNTFTSILRREYKLEELSPLHRLDRDTSGLMVFAKSKEKAKLLQKIDLIQDKTYLAICHGQVDWNELECKTTLGEIKDSSIPIKMHPVDEDAPRAKTCHTSFKRLASTSYYSLIQAQIHTGRKHQIRAHLASLGFPIVGDRMYSFDGTYYLKMTTDGLTEKDYSELGAKHQLLHSWKSKIIVDSQDQLNPINQVFTSKIFCDDFKDYLKLFSQEIVENIF